MMKNDRLQQAQAGLIGPEFIRAGDMNLKTLARLRLPFVCGGLKDNRPEDNARNRFAADAGNDFRSV